MVKRPEQGGTYGWRARVGVVYPGSGGADPDFWNWLPTGVSVHFARVESGGDSALAEIERLANSDLLASAGAQIARIPVDSAVYACTSASFVYGRDNDRDLKRALSESAMAPATTTSSSIVEALKELEVNSVAIAGPYLESVVERFAAYLVEHGFDVVGYRSMNLLTDWDLCQQSDESIYRFVKSAELPSAEAIVVPETQFARNYLVPYLEDDLHVPIITANIASMWGALRLAGVHWTRVHSGRLLESRGIRAKLPVAGGDPDSRKGQRPRGQS